MVTFQKSSVGLGQENGRYRCASNARLNVVVDGIFLIVSLVQLAGWVLECDRLPPASWVTIYRQWQLAQAILEPLAKTSA